MVRRSCIVLAIGFPLLAMIGWVRSLSVSDEISLLTHADTRYALATHPHGLELEVITHFRSHPPTWNPISATPPAEGWGYSKRHKLGLHGEGPFYWWDPPAHYFAGMGYETATDNWTYPGGRQIVKRSTDIDVPFWPIVLVSTFPSILALVRLSRRGKRIRGGRCLSCGYDLRGSPGECPECGASRPGVMLR